MRWSARRPTAARPSNGRSALAPDVILMDLVMPRLDGIGAMRELRARSSSSRVIVLTSFLDDERLMPALEAGASGYLLKDVEPAELARAVRSACADEALIDPTVAARLLRVLSSRARPVAHGPSSVAKVTGASTSPAVSVRCWS